MAREGCSGRLAVACASIGRRSIPDLQWRRLVRGGKVVKTMRLYQRGKKHIYYVDYSADGRRIQESTGTANRREAEIFKALRISEVQRGVFVKPVNTTLAEFGEWY